MPGSSDVRAGGAYVEVFAKNEGLERGLTDSARRLKTFADFARSTAAVAVSTGGAAVGVGIAGAALAGRALAGSMKAAGGAMASATSRGSTGLGNVREILERLTPLSTKLWDVTQSGVGRGTRLLSSLRQGLAAAGASAKPLLDAFDQLSKKGAGIAFKSFWGSALRGDFKAAAVGSHALKAGREAYLADRMRGFLGNIGNVMVGPLAGRKGLERGGRSAFSAAGQAASYLNIRGGQLAGAGLNLTGKALQGLASVANRAAKPLRSVGTTIASVATHAVRGAAQITGLSNSMSTAERSAGRLLPKLSGIVSALKGASMRAGLVGGGILGGLTAAAALHTGGGLSDMLSAHGFAQHATEMGEGARKHGMTVESYSAYHSAAKIAGTTIDDAQKDPTKMWKVNMARSKAVSLGGFVTGEQVALATKATTAIAEMGVAFRGVGTAIGTAVLPQITAGVEWITRTAAAVGGFIQENPKLIQQLFQVGRAFAIGAAVAGGLATAIGFIASPMGLLTITVGAVTAAFPTLWASAKQNFGSITTALTEMGGFFQEVFGGIINALSAGELGLAAEVAWAGIQVAFETGIAIVAGLWNDWSASIMNTLDGGLTEARAKLDEWFPGFEGLFSSSMAFLQDAWTVTVNGFLYVWDSAFAVLRKSINYLIGLFSKGFDIKGANARIDEEFTKKAAGRGKAQDELLAKRDAERRKREAAIAKNGVRATLESELEERKKAREAAKGTGEGSERLKAAQLRLNAALKRAERAKHAKDKERSAKVDDAGLNVAAGVSKTETRGAAANDIRTKEGLSDLLVAFRGQRSNWQADLVLAGKAAVKEAKEANVAHEKNRRLLYDIKEELPLNSLPIGQ